MENTKHLTPVQKYAKAKIKFLSQFGIYPDKKETEHFYELPTEIAVDNFAHELFMIKL